MIFTQVAFYTSLVVSSVTYTENGIHRCAPQPTPDSGSLVGTVDSIGPKNIQRYDTMELPVLTAPDGVSTVNLGIRGHGGEPSFVMITDSTSRKIYGWVDSITPVTSVNGSMTRVRWHIDWWLTAGNSAVYGSGRMLRGPASYARPDPSEPRLWEMSSSTPLRSLRVTTSVGTFTHWVIVLYTTANLGYTALQIATWPVGYTTEYNGITYETLGLKRLYEGILEEILGIAASSIIGCWISPIPPVDPAGLDGTVNKWIYHATQDGDLPYATWIEYAKFGSPFTASIPGSFGTLKTTDQEKYVIIDPEGGIAATAPWGISFKNIDLCVDVGTTGAQLLIYFRESATGLLSTGRLVTIPLISVPITSNAVTDYVYSGERDYDKSMRLIQQQQALVSGITGAGQSAIGGAIAGGNVSTAGAGAGAAAGAIAAVGGSIANYYATGHFDRKTQAAVDRYKSNQISSIISASNGWSWTGNLGNGVWGLYKIERDSVSAAELTTEQSELGYLTDTQVANCTTLISGKGPLKIEGLEVSGVSPEGNNYISQMFARGVHLD